MMNRVAHSRSVVTVGHVRRRRLAPRAQLGLVSPARGSGEKLRTARKLATVRCAQVTSLARLQYSAAGVCAVAASLWNAAPAGGWLWNGVQHRY